MKYFFLFFSFLLDGYFSNTAVTLFTLTAFVLLLPYFKESEFFLCMMLFGFLMDLIYTTSFGFYLLLFSFFSCLLSFFYKRFSYHIFNLLWMLTLCILLYCTMFFFFRPVSDSFFILGSSCFFNLCYLLFFNFVFQMFHICPKKKE